MDHAVYERKNTDLGSTSMTKSGGFSIKKRHRKLGALIGLAALAVPFAANLGTLGDAIHAVTGPQNVYESELLNVKLKTSQDKTKTTWDLEFDRSQTSVSEQTVKFKLDLDKAGLKDAEIKQDDKALDMREGIVSAVLKSQSTHLILTAISTNEDKHDITLPVTELGLYDEQNGENRLEADNRSIDLTMAFEQVAEIAESIKEEAASSEKEVKEEKAPRMVDGSNDGLITGSDPVVGFNTSLSGSVVAGDEVQTVLISREDRTTPGTNGLTSSDNFQIWANTSVVYHETDHNFTNNQINIYRKFDRAAMKIDGGIQNGLTRDEVRTYYHDQFDQVASGTNNQSSYMIEFPDVNSMSGKKFEILYDNVGYYIDALGNHVTVGASMTIQNIKPVTQGSLHDQTQNHQYFIDVPNQLYSGILYQGIDTLDIQIQFFTTDGNGTSKANHFTGLLDLGTLGADNTSKAVMTFASLNNFGDANGDFLWTESGSTTIKNSTYAESVDLMDSFSDTDLAANRSLGITAKDGTGKAFTSMAQDSSANGKWYSKGHGNYTNNDYSDPNWRDLLGDATFPKGALSYPIQGKQYTFRLYTGTGNTWQTITCATTSPLQLDAPKKTVTSNNLTGGSQTAINQMLSTEQDSKTIDFEAKARETFAENHKPADYASLALYIAARETYVNEQLSKKNASDKYDFLYGDMFDQNVAIKASHEENDKPYFYYDYWVFQKTYEIGSESIAKPGELVMTDTLDKGVLLQNSALNSTFTNPTSIVVYNTDGTPFVSGQDYNATVEPDGDSQKITVTFTAAGLNKAKFNGGYISWNLNVKVDADAAAAASEDVIQWLNTANVKTKVNEATGIDTNTVPVHLTPLKPNDLKIHKVDEDGNGVQGVEFELWHMSEANGIDDQGNVMFKPINNGTGELVTDPDISNSGKQWLWTGLEVGAYELRETKTPGGYSEVVDTINFTLNSKRDSDNGDDYDYSMVVDPADIAALASLTKDDSGAWAGDVVNVTKRAQIQLKKVDADGKKVEGAKFKYALASADLTKDENWTDLTEIVTTDSAMHVDADSAKLKFNQVYIVR